MHTLATPIKKLQSYKPFVRPQPLKQRRYPVPKVRAVTLCIAIHADDDGDRSIVLCSDSQIGDDLSVSSEAEFKGDLEFGPGVAAMYSGPVDQAEDAFEIFKRRLRSNPLTLSGYKEEFAVGMKEFKAALVRRGERRSEVELIIAGFIERDPKIVHVFSRVARAVPFFVSIGTGSAVADGILRWRAPTQHTTLHQAMYLAYEAKKLGEASPHVGKEATNVIVLNSNKDGSLKKRLLNRRGLEHLKRMFDEFGPKAVQPNIRFPWKELELLE